MDVYVPALDGEEEGMVIIKDRPLRLRSGVLAQIHYVDLSTTAIRKLSISPSLLQSMQLKQNEA